MNMMMDGYVGIGSSTFELTLTLSPGPLRPPRPLPARCCSSHMSFRPTRQTPPSQRQFTSHGPQRPSHEPRPTPTILTRWHPSPIARRQLRTIPPRPYQCQQPALPTRPSPSLLTAVLPQLQPQHGPRPIQPSSPPPLPRPCRYPRPKPASARTPAAAKSVPRSLWREDGSHADDDESAATSQQFY